MQWKSLIFLSLALLVHESHAHPPSSNADMLRFACSQLVVERLDPIVSPGVNGSSHVHQIVGGNSFSPSMPTTYDAVASSSCTSCTYSEDFSNYWTADLYFKARNGTFKRVPQQANGGLVQNGGLTAYYIPPYDGVTNVTTFKPVSRSDIHATDNLILTVAPGLSYASRKPHEPKRFRSPTSSLPSLYGRKLRPRKPFWRTTMHRK